MSDMHRPLHHADKTQRLVGRTNHPCTAFSRLGVQGGAHSLCVGCLVTEAWSVLQQSVADQIKIKAVLSNAQQSAASSPP